jgi:hypothetical protein
MYGTDVKDSGLRWFGVELPTRHNVREPIHAPVLKVVTPKGIVRCVPMTEAQLLEMVAQAVKTLDLMRKCRNATVPK